MFLELMKASVLYESPSLDSSLIVQKTHAIRVVRGRVHRRTLSHLSSRELNYRNPASTMALVAALKGMGLEEARGPGVQAGGLWKEEWATRKQKRGPKKENHFAKGWTCLFVI